MAYGALILHLLALHTAYGQHLAIDHNVTESEWKFDLADHQPKNVAGDSQVFGGKLPVVNSIQPTGTEKSSQQIIIRDVTTEEEGLASNESIQPRHNETEDQDTMIPELCSLFYVIFTTIMQGMGGMLFVLVFIGAVVSLLETCRVISVPLIIKRLFHYNSAPKAPTAIELGTVATDTVY